MVRALKLFGCLSIAVLCLTGCSSEETLTCSMEDESSGVSMEQIVEMTFKDACGKYLKQAMELLDESKEMKSTTLVRVPIYRRR